MREIKFRGIDKDGHFVIGNVVYNFCYDDMDIVECAICFENDWVPVKIETIGQYTGLKDRNGLEIYEGDIIKYKKIIAKVLWNNENLSFMFESSDGGYQFVNGILYDKNKEYETYEVIGNIYENKGATGLKIQTGEQMEDSVNKIEEKESSKMIEILKDILSIAPSIEKFELFKVVEYIIDKLNDEQ